MPKSKAKLLSGSSPGIAKAPAGQPKLSPGRKSASTVFGSKSYTSRSSHVPAAFNTQETGTTFTRTVGNLKHSREGVDGIAVVGCQPLVTIQTAAASSDLFVANSLATQTTANSIPLNPDAFNGPLAAMANFHLKYVFTDVILEYVSTVATTQAGACSISITEGYPDTKAASFAEVRQVSDSVTFPFRADRTYLHYHYNGDNLFYTELDGATTAGFRLTYQGLIEGWPQASSLGAVTQGYINVWYRIELYVPMYTQGVTLRMKSKEDHQLLVMLRENYNREYMKRCLVVGEEGENDVETFPPFSSFVLSLLKRSVLEKSKTGSADSLLSSSSSVIGKEDVAKSRSWF